MSNLQNNYINVTKVELPNIDDYIKYLKIIWDNAWVTNEGPLIQELEKKLCQRFDLEHLTLVTNATLALQLCFEALELTGEVITTPYTFVATSNTLIWEKLTPVFVDVDPETYNIDPQKIAEKITKKTSAILGVHVYGNPCNVQAIQKIAKKHNLKVIYDAAHAFDVNYQNKSILKYGDAAILSFHATKVFNTIEGGAIYIKSKKLDQKLRLLRNFGIKSEEETVLAGINTKMSEFQAAMGLTNLPLLKNTIAKRKELNSLYKKELSINPNVKFQKLVTEDYNYAYMPVCFKNKAQRDLIYNELLKNKIKARKYFYPLVSDFDYIKKVSKVTNNGYPVAKRISNSILCLPMYSTLSMNTVNKIISIIKKCL